MSQEGGDETVRVQLARIEGKMDLSNLRHDQTDAWKLTVDSRLHTHGNRIGNIEAREHLREGERKGIAVSSRVMWAVVGFVPPAIVAGLKVIGL